MNHESKSSELTNYELTQRFFFDAAHTLKRPMETAGSRRVHGHTYHAELRVRGAPDPATGMVLDLGLLRAEAGKLRELLDHHMLDEVAGLGRPTLENLCAYIARHAQSAGLPLSGVAVWREGIGDRCSLTLA